MSVRVRFAPSPTGSLHVGALRDALFKHLFAKHHGGANILRIEDTDRSRYSPEAEQEFIESLRWVGIDYDEGPHVGGPHAPYRQSERKEAGIYAREIGKLLAAGHAYKAFDTTEELDAMREFQTINRQAVGYYGGVWRDASPEQVAEAEAAGKPFVIRQRIPKDTTIVIEDAIRGRIEWDSNTIDDPVLIKADGMPTYHFAAMVDDHLMGITHIIRGEEWISSAPKHAALFDSFGWERPIFVHCPVIKGKDGKKLSKRHGATRVLDYRSDGFLPEALNNFVVLIGWSPGGDREVMTKAEMIEAFDIGGLQPSPGLFDFEKLRWMNGHYIRSKDAEVLFSEVVEYASDPEIRHFLTHKEIEPGIDQSDPAAVVSGLAILERAAKSDPALVREAIKLEQERVTTLADFGPATEFFFLEEPPMDEKAVSKWFGQPHVGELFDFLIERLTAPRAALPESTSTNRASAEWCEAIIRQFAADKGFDKLGPVVHPTRVALTGKTVGPGLFELMSALGPVRMVRRLQRARRMLAE
jgi:glutamyl-tRNA synthetase